MAKDRHKEDAHCPNCNSKATLSISENDGFSFAKRGPQSVVTGISGSIIVKGDSFSCKECDHKWPHGAKILEGIISS